MDVLRDGPAQPVAAQRERAPGKRHARKEGEAFDRAQQLAKDKGVEVKLSSAGGTLSVTVQTKSDGKSDSLDLNNSLDLNKPWLEHILGVRASEGGGA